MVALFVLKIESLAKKDSFDWDNLFLVTHYFDLSNLSFVTQKENKLLYATFYYRYEHISWAHYLKEINRFQIDQESLNEFIKKTCFERYSKRDEAQVSNVDKYDSEPNYS